MHMVIDPRAKYKLKWNVPLNDVDIVEYGPGVNILTNSYRTTISHSKEGKFTVISSNGLKSLVSIDLSSVIVTVRACSPA